MKAGLFGLSLAGVWSIAHEGKTQGTYVLPKEFQRGLSTFYQNPNLNESANILIHSLPFIGEMAIAQTPDEHKHNPGIVGRRAYEILAEYFGKGGPEVASKDFSIPSPEGHQIPLRRYQGKDSKRTILFIHGGGWSRGNLKTHDQLCRKLVDETGYNLIAVDYRLAPENPFPNGLNDVAAAYEWLLTQPDLSHDIIVAGDSGGGNLSASLVLQRIQQKRSLPKGLILIYPALDLRVPKTTANPYASGYMLTRDSTNQYIHNYLGDEHAEKALDPIISPVLASDTDLKQFPPTVMIAAQCDPLTESITVFAQRLERIQKKVNFKVIPRTIHIFAQFFDLFPEAQQGMDFINEHAKKF